VGTLPLCDARAQLVRPAALSKLTSANSRASVGIVYISSQVECPIDGIKRDLDGIKRDLVSARKGWYGEK